MTAKAKKKHKNNDKFYKDGDRIRTMTNHAGGTLGGITTGEDIVLRVAVKPPSSIAQPQQTVTRDGEATTIEIKGRHDPCVGIRAVPIAEAMLAITIMDHLMRHRAQNIDVSVDTPDIAAK